MQFLWGRLASLSSNTIRAGARRIVSIAPFSVVDTEWNVDDDDDDDEQGKRSVFRSVGHVPRSVRDILVDSRSRKESDWRFKRNRYRALRPELRSENYSESAAHVRNNITVTILTRVPTARHTGRCHSS